MLILKKILKITGIILAVIIGIVLIIIAGLIVLSNMPSPADKYWEKIETGRNIEKKFCKF